MDTPTLSSRSGELIAGRFRLERLLGHGGMGDVYVATQLPIGRAVALKVMRSTLSTSAHAAARFEREARALATLAHPNIVTLFDFGRTDDGGLFLAMELLPGESLRARLSAWGRLPVDKALAVTADVCRGLEAAHRAGIVHRDLKPDNVMLVDLSKSGVAGDVVKVLDFGVAGVQQGTDMSAAPLTISGNVVGTPGYIAPEALLSGVVDDPRSDQYAVGVMLWELLTNHAVFQAPTPMALVVRHAFDPPPTLSSVLPEARPHPALEALLQRLLAKEPEQRFASAAAIADAIAALPAAARAPLPGVVVAPTTSTAPTATPPRRPDGAVDADGATLTSPPTRHLALRSDDASLDPDAPTSIALPAFVPPAPVTTSTPPGALPLVVAQALSTASPATTSSRGFPVAALVAAGGIIAVVVVVVVALARASSPPAAPLAPAVVAPVVVPVVLPAPVVAPAAVVAPIVAPPSSSTPTPPARPPPRPPSSSSSRPKAPTLTPHVPDMSP